MLLADCSNFFGTNDLYEVFNVEKTCKAAEVKKAYYRQSLKWHPDRFASADEQQRQTATQKFQVLTKVYEILSDKEKRAIYDETGAIDEENVLGDEASFEDAVRVWRGVFKKVNFEEIEKYMSKYAGSEEQKSDVKLEYERWDGDMDKVLEYVIGDDEQQIRELIDGLIAEGQLKSTKKFKSSTGKTKTNARKRKAEKEAKEAEESLAQIKQKEGDGDLRALILGRQQNRAHHMDSFVDALAAKYGGQPQKKKGKKGK